MEKHEFENLTGLQVSNEEYARIYDLYLCSRGMTKEEFCKEYVIAKDLRLVDELHKYIGYLFIREKDVEAKMICLARQMVKKSVELEDDELRDDAERIIGMKGVIKCKMENNLPLDSKERIFVSKNLTD